MRQCHYPSGCQQACMLLAPTDGREAAAIGHPDPGHEVRKHRVEHLQKRRSHRG